MPEKTIAEYEAEQAAEWGAYVATSVIHINGSRAFNIGDPVPASHLDRGVVDVDQVAKTTTKAGAAAADEKKG